jgi:hypothetical protein
MKNKTFNFEYDMSLLCMRKCGDSAVSYIIVLQYCSIEHYYVMIAL